MPIHATQIVVRPTPQSVGQLLWVSRLVQLPLHIIGTRRKLVPSSRLWAMIAAQRRQLVLRSLHQIAPSAGRRKCFIAPLLQHVLWLTLVVNRTLERAEALEASTVEITTFLIRQNGAQQPQLE